MLKAYEETHVYVPIDITKDVVQSDMQNLSVSAGPSGTDSEALQGCLLKLGDYIKHFLLLLNLLWTVWTIRTHHGPPIGHLCLAAYWIR